MGPSNSAGFVDLDGTYILHDPDKRPSLDDIESLSSYSSGDGSDTLTGLLSKDVYRKKTALPRSMIRRRNSRYLSSALLASTIFLFLVYLIHQKSRSEASLRLGHPSAASPPWHEFPFLKRYHAGVRSIVPRNANKPEYPDPARELEIGDPAKWNQSDGIEPRSVDDGATERFNPFSHDAEAESRIQCYLDKEGTRVVPSLRTHQGVPDGMPDPVMGSYDIFGLQNEGCFDRFGRLGPYGFGYGRKFGGAGVGLEGEGREQALQDVWGLEYEINYSKVNWADAQARCLDSNTHRYRSAGRSPPQSFNAMADGTPERGSTMKRDSSAPSTHEPDRLNRTAVLIRTWQGYEYDVEDILNLRALINEVSLQSGGEYTVHFLVHVKDNDLQVWADDEVYQRTLNDALPAEFRGMGTLWSERQMGLIYGGVAETMYRDLPVHGVYRSTYMPVQYFAHMHPEYEFFWHWEMDIRYIGHYYHLFDRISSWAKQQPRKGIWERSSRFYVPSEHGSWEDFSHMVRVQTELGTNNRGNMYHKMGKDPKHPDDVKTGPEPPVWGPLRPSVESDHFETHNDPIPPTSFAQDHYVWGVGEEADLITLNPLFDPDQTNWILAEDVTGYNNSQGFPPRRTAIVTSARLSRRLLETMHRETALGRHTMFSEMWPGSCALHHGFKVVYAPHPVYIDRRWPTSYLAAIFNNGRNGASGGARSSVFSDERQHNFLGTTWYYHAGFPGNLWKRWLGYRVDNDGGEEEELAGEGRMCLPSMLLHPVKHVDMIYESWDEAPRGIASKEGDSAA